uniref:Uncharacterized protein n=1 Tax=Octopus bimaculoides TaxID=37653 RepID=A0A0L8I3I2_OCTBM
MSEATKNIFFHRQKHKILTNIERIIHVGKQNNKNKTKKARKKTFFLFNNHQN